MRRIADALGIDPIKLNFEILLAKLIFNVTFLSSVGFIDEICYWDMSKRIVSK